MGETAHWRTLLFVPANNERFIAKAADSAADAIILDLEDSVLSQSKEAARRGVAEAAGKLKRAGLDVLVRINRPLSAAVGDLNAAVCGDVSAIVVAKAANAIHLGLLSEVIEEREAALGLAPGHTRLIPLVETAEAVERLDEIGACDRVCAIVCGDEDLAADLGCGPGSDTITSIKYRLVLAAAASGIRPLGLIGSIAEFRDLEKYQACLNRSRAAGLKGTLCIHPTQVQLANRAFMPTETEVAHAARVVAAAKVAREAGSGAIALDGAMIDAPVVRRAEALIEANRRYSRH